MTRVKETDSIQVAKQLIDSFRQNFRWETCKLDKALETIEELKENIITYYKIKNR